MPCNTASNEAALRERVTRRGVAHEEVRATIRREVVGVLGHRLVHGFARSRGSRHGFVRRRKQVPGPDRAEGWEAHGVSQQPQR